MSQRRWLALFVLVGALLSVFYLYSANRSCPIEQSSAPDLNWSLIPQLNQNKEHEGAAYRYGRKKNIDHSVAASVPYSYALVQKQKTENESEHGHPKSNIWLTKFFCDAKLSDLLIALFTYGLFLATGWLVWATLKLWKAGEDQAKLTRHAMTSIERAFVFHTLFPPVTEIDRKTGELLTLNFKTEWKNSGRTPTKWLLSRLNLIYFDGPEMWAGFKFSDQGDKQSNYAVIGPGATVNSAIISTPRKDLVTILDNARSLYVYGWVEYDDVFEDTPRHRTEFCYRIYLHPNSDGVAITTQLHDRYNGADDECGERFVKAQIERPTRAPIYAVMAATEGADH